MERQQAKCPNCGSAEFIAPVIDEMAWLLAGNNPTVTVTCTHCGSKYQTNASVNMVKPEAPTPPPAQIYIVQAPAAPTERTSMTGLKFGRVLAIIFSVPAGLAAIVSLVAVFSDGKPEETSGLIIATVIFASFTLFFVLMARYFKKRIKRGY
ncbi:MAG: hypothetical protein J7623_18605 [Chitinophaga sp.]|uniref:hypothetical protein n=1 Tax=Chitinophaga sp. TaxID=1869181 RepID=UPI001B135B0D|nr:hypothetical protein [Chitinophaga sp.]MBO9730661.1 hypothetical protein [Chitinophaga sp.]